MTVEDIKRLNQTKFADIQFLSKSEFNLVLSICYILYKVLLSLLRFQHGQVKLGEIHIIALTINNQKTIKGIIQHLPAEKVTIWKDKKEDIPNSVIYLRSFRYIPLLIRLYLTSTKSERMIIRHYCLDFFRTCALYNEIDKIYNKNPNLKMVIFPNDHYLESRCYIELAKKYGVKTLYVQHASVNATFPPLQFTYAFLDGLQSYEMYKNIGDIDAEIFLTGSPRFDMFSIYNKKDPKYEIGVALNRLDDQQRVLELCQYLKKHYSSSIIVRPHAGMVKDFDWDIFTSEGFGVSNPQKELSFHFLRDIKVMIANESGIHLDAALMHVPSLLYNFSDNKVMDWYSFIKNRLICVCNCKEDVLNMLKSEIKLNKAAVRFYNASFETPYEGKVSNFISDFILKDLYMPINDSHVFIDSYMKKIGMYWEYK